MYPTHAVPVAFRAEITKEAAPFACAPAGRGMCLIIRLVTATTKGISKEGGHTSRGSARMMVRVVMSSVTRVLGVSFSLLTFGRQPTTYRGPLLALTMTAMVAGSHPQ